MCLPASPTPFKSETLHNKPSLLGVAYVFSYPPFNQLLETEFASIISSDLGPGSQKYCFNNPFDKIYSKNGVNYEISNIIIIVMQPLLETVRMASVHISVNKFPPCRRLPDCREQKVGVHPWCTTQPPSMMHHTTTIHGAPHNHALDTIPDIHTSTL